MLRCSSAVRHIHGSALVKTRNQRWLFNGNIMKIVETSKMTLGRSTCRNRKLSNTPIPTPKGNNGSSSGKTAGGKKPKIYMDDLDRTLASYHHAKLAALRGEIKLKEPPPGNKGQFFVIIAFIVAFGSTPLIGKKIAQDDEFRKKYVPSWYDFTIQQPKDPWTREERAEQILQIEKEIRERAMNGDFTPDKLAKMRQYMDGVDPDKNSKWNPSKDRHAWTKLHPGVDDDEDVYEDDD